MRDIFVTKNDQVEPTFAGDAVDQLLHDAISQLYPDCRLKGEANVLYVQDLSRLHGSPFWLYLLFCWMQDHNAKIVTVACDIRYSLHYDLHIEQKLLERAARKGRDVPWIV